MDIDKILLKYLSNKTTKEEYDILQAWKQESEHNINMLQELEKSNSPTAYEDFDKLKAWKSIEAQIDFVTPTKSPRLSNNSILVIVSLFFFTAIVAYFGLRKQKTPFYQSNQETLVVPLADNSIIYLKSGGSKLEVQSDFENSRIVRLNGEAFFDVAPDKARPFIIQLKEEEYIKVVGTSFNLINTEEAFDLTIYEGVVEMHALGRVITLKENDRLTLVKNSLTKTKNSDKNRISWKSNTLEFNNAYMADIATALERHFSIRIIFPESNNLLDCRLRSRFTTESIDEVMKELEKHYQIDYTLEGKRLTISEISCL